MGSMVILRKISWQIAVAFLAASCAVETPDNPEPAPQGEPLTTINASIEQEADTGRTSISYESSAGGSSSAPVMVWSTNDKITVMASDESSGVFTIQSGQDTRTARFDGYLASNATPYYAFYPSSFGAVLDEGKIKFSLPQTQTASTTASGLMPAVAYLPSASGSTTFRNLCGMLRISLKGSATLGKVELYALGGEMLWGDATLTASTTLDNPATWVRTLSGGDNKLILDLSTTSGKTLTSSATSFYFTIPPGALSSGARIVVYNDGGTAIDEFCTGADLSVSRAHVVPAGTVEINEFTLLDLDGSANCYIADRSATSTSYKFCTFMGNSGTLIPAAASSVEELWETLNGNSSFNGGNTGYLLDALSCSGGCISFKVLNRSGNALIAARNDSDEIMWSWHIWLPYGGSVASGTLGNGTVCMDRNLGALSASTTANSIGLLYQWGRKDPFMGPYQLIGYCNTLMLTNPAGAITQQLTTTATVAWSILNPTVIVDKESGGYWDSENLASWTGTGKTTHDPCPPGWRIPTKDELANLEFGEWDDTNHWYTESASSLNFGGTGRQYYSPSLSSHTVESSQVGRYWTSVSGQQQAGTYTVSSDNKFTYTTINKHICHGVRCVAE